MKIDEVPIGAELGLSTYGGRRGVSAHDEIVRTLGIVSRTEEVGSRYRPKTRTVREVEVEYLEGDRQGERRTVAARRLTGPAREVLEARVEQRDDRARTAALVAALEAAEVPGAHVSDYRGIAVNLTDEGAEYLTQLLRDAT